VDRHDLGTLNSLVTFAAENIPGGLNSDEQAIAKIVGIWVVDGIPVVQICPHCGQPATGGPDRIEWLEQHIDSAFHRGWWGAKNQLRAIGDALSRI
jgi:hypothetical protein